MTKSPFDTRFTYGATRAPDGQPGVVLRDYEQGLEIPFYLMDTAENLAIVILTAAFMIRDDNTPVLIDLDAIDVELREMTGEASQTAAFYGTTLGNIPLSDNEELPINLPED